MESNTKTSAQFAKLEDWRVAYESHGQADLAIVLVHGWGVDRSMWSAQLEGLKIDRRTIAVDLIGHGESDKPMVDYTVKLLARSVAAVMDHAGLSRAILVGHSAGVPVIREFQLLYPDRTEALIVADGPLRQVVSKQMAKAMADRFRGPDYQESIRQIHSFLKPVGELTQADIDSAVNSMLATPHHVLMSTFEAQQVDGYWKTASIDVPVLAVYAKNPMWPMWSDEYERFVRELVPGVEYHTWEATSHLLNIERATEFNALIGSFVKRVEGAGSADGDK